MKRSLEESQLTWSKGFELVCKCGRNAKPRISRTYANPFRIFYNCPKTDFGDVSMPFFNFQCDFFHWADELYPTGDKHLDDLNEISRECKRLKEIIDLIQEHNNERAAWNRERAEIMSQLSSVKAELDQFKTLNESDLMPPYDDDELSSSDDGALVIQTV